MLRGCVLTEIISRKFGVLVRFYQIQPQMQEVVCNLRSAFVCVCVRACVCAHMNLNLINLSYSRKNGEIECFFRDVFGLAD